MAAISIRWAGQLRAHFARKQVPGLSGFTRSAGPMVRAALSGLSKGLPDVLAIEFLLAATAYLFRDAIRDGMLFHEADTSTMFYPVFAALGAALGRGELLLWTPQLFTGFPLMAEGQTGVFYPPNWLAASFLPAQQGFVWLRLVHYWLAVLFSYLFAPSLPLAPGPAS